MTLFGFVFVVVSSCLLHCSSFVVAGGLLLIVIEVEQIGMDVDS